MPLTQEQLKQIRTDLEKAERQLKAVEPEIEKAKMAGLPIDEYLKRARELRDKIEKAKLVYGR